MRRLPKLCPEVTLRSNVDEVLLYADSRSADILLVSQDKKKFKSHKIVLMSSCEMFYSIFKTSFDYQSNENDVLVFDQVPGHILRSFLELIYTGQCVRLSSLKEVNQLKLFCSLLKLRSLDNLEETAYWTKLSSDQHFAFNEIVSTEKNVKVITPIKTKARVQTSGNISHVDFANKFKTLKAQMMEKHNQRRFKYLTKQMKCNQKFPHKFQNYISDIIDRKAISNTVDNLIDISNSEEQFDLMTNHSSPADKLDFDKNNQNENEKEVKKFGPKVDSNSVKKKKTDNFNEEEDKCPTCPVGFQFKLSNQVIICCCSGTLEKNMALKSSEVIQASNSMDKIESGSALQSNQIPELMSNRHFSPMEIECDLDPIIQNMTGSEETLEQFENSGDTELTETFNIVQNIGSGSTVITNQEIMSKGSFYQMEKNIEIDFIPKKICNESPKESGKSVEEEYIETLNLEENNESGSTLISNHTTETGNITLFSPIEIYNSINFTKTSEESRDSEGERQMDTINFVDNFESESVLLSNYHTETINKKPFTTNEMVTDHHQIIKVVDKEPSEDITMNFVEEGIFMREEIVLPSDDCDINPALKLQKLIYCQFCGMQLKSFALRHKHLISNHTQEKKSPNSDSILHICLICLKEFSTTIPLANHMVKHTTQKKKVPKVPKALKFACDQCGKGFKDKSHLSMHVFVHIPDRPFSCDACGKGFKMKKSLAQHLQMHQGPIMTCNFCDFQSHGKHLLSMHLLNVHQGKHGCEECGKRCVSKSNMEKHKRKHSGEKLFVCDQCGFGFAQSGGLKSHKEAVHSTQEKTFICNQCLTKFRTIFLLKNHVKSVHSDERNFQCTVCSKKYKNPYHLKQHMELHSGVIIQCETCPKTFRCRDNYRKHFNRKQEQNMKVTE